MVFTLNLKLKLKENNIFVFDITIWLNITRQQSYSYLNHYIHFNK